MAGWRVGFMLGNPEVVAALARLKSYLDYGTFQPIQIASIVAMNEAPEYPREVNHVYLGRRDTLVDGLARLGWEIDKPRGTMFVWAPLPAAYEELGSLEFAKMLVQRRQGRGVAGRGVRPRRRGVRTVRAGRERAAHRPGAARDPQGAGQARLTAFRGSPRFSGGRLLGSRVLGCPPAASRFSGGRLRGSGCSGALRRLSPSGRAGRRRRRRPQPGPPGGHARAGTPGPAARSRRRPPRRGPPGPGPRSGPRRCRP